MTATAPDPVSLYTSGATVLQVAKALGCSYDVARKTLVARPADQAPDTGRLGGQVPRLRGEPHPAASLRAWHAPAGVYQWGGDVVKPRLLDLFAGGGGAGMGYHRAGFEVVGVDIRPQPRYPFEFHQADAMTFPLDGFDAIHASPPCQDHSVLHRNYGAPSHGTGDLLVATLARLRETGLPWVVENVVGAPLPSAFVLCGASFGLGASGLDLNRHRQFETSFAMLAPPCQHRPGKTIGVYGNGTNAWHRKKLGRNLAIAEMREAMGIDWMNRTELTQAVPPAYTLFIGEQLLASLALEPTS